MKEGNKKTRQRPTLAQALQALPLATQRLTAEFGMGSGVASSLLSPARLFEESRDFGEIKFWFPSLTPKGWGGG